MKITVITECQRCGAKQTDEFTADDVDKISKDFFGLLAMRTKEQTGATYFCETCLSEYREARAESVKAREQVMLKFWNKYA